MRALFASTSACVRPVPCQLRASLLCACLLLVLADTRPLSRVQAQEVWGLRVHAPRDAGCATTAELARRVEVRIGRRVFAAELANAEARFEVTIKQNAAAGSFRARVQTFDRRGEPSGERVVEVRDAGCQALDDLLTLIIAASVGVADSALLPTPPARPQPPPNAPRRKHSSRPSNPPPSAASAPAPALPRLQVGPGFDAMGAPPKAAPTEFTLGVSLRLQTALLPELAYGPSVQLHAVLRVFELYGAVSFLPRRSAALPDLGLSRASAAFAEFGGCAIVARPFGAGRVGLCVGLATGALWIETLEFYRGTSNRELVLFGAPALHLLVPLATVWGFEASAGLSLPIASQRFSYIDANEMRRIYHEVGIGAWLRAGFFLGFGS